MFAQTLETGVGLEALSDLLREQALGEGEYDGHGPGQVEEVYLPVPHGQGALAAREGLGDLGGGPQRDLVPADRFLVHDVGEAAHLVLLVVQQGLEGHDVHAHHVAGGEAAGVEGAGLGEDDPPAVSVPVRQRENVAHVNQFRQLGILNKIICMLTICKFKTKTITFFPFLRPCGL